MPTAKNLSERLRAAALHQPASPKVEAPAPPSEPEPEPEPQQKPARQARAATRRKQRMIRYTLDLEPKQHRWLRRQALDSEVRTSDFMRAALEELAGDKELLRRVMDKARKLKGLDQEGAA